MKNTIILETDSNSLYKKLSISTIPICTPPEACNGFFWEDITVHDIMGYGYDIVSLTFNPNKNKYIWVLEMDKNKVKKELIDTIYGLESAEC